MTKSAVTDWSTTASNNTDVGGIGIEGSNTISNMDNAIREIMAQIATFNTAATFGGITLTSTDAGATTGPVLTLYRNSASPAASDIIGKVLFQGEDSAGNTQDYAEIYCLITDPTSTSEDANLLFRNVVAGTMTTQASVNSTGWNAMNIGATVPGTGAFTTLSATGNFSISKATPVITLTHTGTGSDSTITENSSGLTYAADANNEVASSFHIWTVDGTQAAALNTSALTLGTNVALAFAGTGAATTRTNLGLVIGTNVQAWDADLDTWATKTAPSGVVVGTTDSQTLTNKTLTGAALNGTLGATTPAAAAVTTLDASSTITAVDSITVTSTDAGTGTGPFISLYRDSASPAAADNLGILRWDGEDSAGNLQRYADIFPTLIDPTSTSEDATLNFRIVIAGTVTTMATLSAAGFSPSTSLNLPIYTVAGLPAAGTAGRMAYASNLRVFNGAGTQEGAGLGTGGTVVDNGTAWKISGTNVTAVA